MLVNKTIPFKDERMYIFDYNYDRKTLGEYFNKMQLDSRMISKFWPWPVPNSNEKVFNGVVNGWELKGFRPSDTMDGLSNNPKKNNPIIQYPYLLELMRDFCVFDLASALYFRFKPGYTSFVHRDGEDYYIKQKAGADNPSIGEQLHKPLKSRTSLNFIVNDSTPVNFTKNDDKYMTDQDYQYTYSTALLNTWKHHYVKTSNEERLLFKIQIYEPDFEGVYKRMKALGL